jgi:hypothetical protein
MNCSKAELTEVIRGKVFSLRLQHAANPAMGYSQVSLPTRVARVLLGQALADGQIFCKGRLSLLQFSLRLQHAATGF